LQTKLWLAAAMVHGLHTAGILPFRYIVADCLYGNSPEFWAACEACIGTVALVACLGQRGCDCAFLLLLVRGGKGLSRYSFYAAVGLLELTMPACE
jgi:hypothetical protein